MVEWDIKIACEKVLQHFIDERNKAPRCIVCNSVLYKYNIEIHNYIYLLEVKHRKINVSMFPTILKYVFTHYPYNDDKDFARHHVNYAKNIQLPVCSSCHSKIHCKTYPELDKWLPVDKKPKNQGGFDSNVYKPLH